MCVSRFLSITLALVIAVGSFAGQRWANAREDDGAPSGIPLYIYLDDRCGGCGVDSPGCGDCEDMVTYHGIIRRQLGDRLYDGSIEYRMFNCRLLVNQEMYEQTADAFEVPRELFPWLPSTFIGEAGQGVYLVGEASLEIVGETLDKLIAGADPTELQAEINAGDRGYSLNRH